MIERLIDVVMLGDPSQKLAAVKKLLKLVDDKPTTDRSIDPDDFTSYMSRLQPKEESVSIILTLSSFG